MAAKDFEPDGDCSLPFKWVNTNIAGRYFTVKESLDVCKRVTVASKHCGRHLTTLHVRSEGFAVDAGRDGVGRHPVWEGRVALHHNSCHGFHMFEVHLDPLVFVLDPVGNEWQK